MSVIDEVKGKVFTLLGSRGVTRVKQVFLPKSARRHALVGPARLWKMKRDFQIQFLRDNGLETSSRFVDLGCGTLRGGIPLIEYLEPSRYTGIEVRPESMVEALKELTDQGLDHKTPNLICVRDLGQLLLEDRFDVMWAFSVLIHLSDDHLDSALSFVEHHLDAGGVFLANVNVGEGIEGRWDQFPVVRRSISFYEEAAGKRNLSVEDMGSLLELGHDSGVESQDTGRMLRFRRLI